MSSAGSFTLRKLGRLSSQKPNPIDPTSASSSVDGSTPATDAWDVTSSSHGPFVHCGRGIECDDGGSSAVIVDPDVSESTIMTEHLIGWVK